MQNKRCLEKKLTLINFYEDHDSFVTLFHIIQDIIYVSGYSYHLLYLKILCYIFYILYIREIAFAFLFHKTNHAQPPLMHVCFISCGYLAQTTQVQAVINFE